MTTLALDVAPQYSPKVSAGPNRIACRVCGSTQMLSYLNLGKQPHANARQTLDGPLVSSTPLRVFACMKCQLSQLSVVVPPNELYGTYNYRSGVSAGWRAHCATLAKQYGGKEKFVVDIASNDGTLVRAMRATGATAVGVEPSRSFEDCDYDRISRYWSAALVEEFPNLLGTVDVLTAQNVLGHVADVHDFMRGVALALAPNGVAVIEVPYVCDMLRTLSFDTVYHEHLSYWSVTALRELCNAHGVVLCDVQALSLHGGSLRAIIRPDTANIEVRPSIARHLALEVRDLRKSAYLRFSERVSLRMLDLNDELRNCAPYIGFGAAAKTTVTLHSLDVRAYPQVVFDDNAHKQGFAIPGTRVPIANPATHDWEGETRPVCIFSWNWSDDIIKFLRAAGFRGDILIPAPELCWDSPE